MVTQITPQKLGTQKISSSNQKSSSLNALTQQKQIQRKVKDISSKMSQYSTTAEKYGSELQSYGQSTEGVNVEVNPETSEVAVTESTPEQIISSSASYNQELDTLKSKLLSLRTKLKTQGMDYSKVDDQLTALETEKLNLERYKDVTSEQRVVSSLENKYGDIVKGYTQELEKYGSTGENVNVELNLDANQVNVTETSPETILRQEQAYSNVLKALNTRLGKLKSKLQVSGEDSAAIDTEIAALEEQKKSLSEYATSTREQKKILGLQSRYGKERTEFISALETVNVLPQIEKEAKEYELTSKEFQNRLTQFSQQYGNNTDTGLVTELSGEVAALSKEKELTQSYLQKLEGFNPSGAIDVRFEQIMNWTPEEATSSYFAGKRFEKLLTKTQKDDQNLTALGYDINEIKALSEQAQYKEAFSGTPVKYYKYQNKWVKREDIPRSSNYIRSLETKTVMEGATGEQYYGVDPTKKYITYEKEGKTYYQEKPQEYLSSVYEYTNRFSSYNPYELVISDGNIIETQFGSFMTNYDRTAKGNVYSRYSVLPAAQAITQNNELKSLIRQATYKASASGGSTSKGSFTFQDYKPYQSQVVEFESGRLKQKTEYSPYRANKDYVFSLKPYSKNGKSGFSTELSTSTKKQGIAPFKITSYNMSGFSATGYNMPQTYERSNIGDINATRRLLQQGIISKPSQYNQFQVMQKAFNVNSAGFKAPKAIQEQIKFNAAKLASGQWIF